MITVRAVTAVSFAALALTQGQAFAQSFPSKRITMVVAFSAGVSNDIIGRAMAPKMADGLGQPVIVDNRPGASGNIGAEFVAKSPPDGYTLFIAGGSFTLNMHVTKVNFDVSNFAGVSLLGTLPYTVSAASGLGVKSLSQLVAMAKAKPGALSGATGGNTSAGYFMLDALNKAAGIDVELVAYKGNPEAIADLMAGRVQVMFASMVTSLPPHKSGKLPMLGITGSKRNPLAPDVPTFVESGYPMLDVPQWSGILAPAGTPRPVLTRLSAESVKALRVKEVQDQVAQFGFELSPGSPEEMDAFVKADYAKWGSLVKAAGVKPQ